MGNAIKRVDQFNEDFMEQMKQYEKMGKIIDFNYGEVEKYRHRINCMQVVIREMHFTSPDEKNKSYNLFLENQKLGHSNLAKILGVYQQEHK